jgi:hypothetical protein
MGEDRKGVKKVNKVDLKTLMVTLKRHHKRIMNAPGITPGDVKAISQDLLQILGAPLPERVTGLLVRALDLSPAGGKKWIVSWLERATVKIELMTVSGLEELEPGYAGLLLEPSRLPGEGRPAGE